MASPFFLHRFSQFTSSLPVLFFMSLNFGGGQLPGAFLCSLMFLSPLWPWSLDLTCHRFCPSVLKGSKCRSSLARLGLICLVSSFGPAHIPVLVRSLDHSLGSVAGLHFVQVEEHIKWEYNGLVKPVSCICLVCLCVLRWVPLVSLCSGWGDLFTGCLVCYEYALGVSSPKLSGTCFCRLLRFKVYSYFS